MTTKALYQFDLSVVPAALMDIFGNLLAEASYNGETVIQANVDGSVARGVATGPPADASTTDPGQRESIWAAYVAPSLWEEA